MLCDNCHKNEATVLFSETINGYHTEHHLCQKCASESEATSFGYHSSFLGQEFSLGNLLSTVLGLSNGYTGAKPHVDSTLHCDNCGMTYNEFLKKGKFGCRNCIASFGPKLDDSLKRIHGSDIHTGKKPINYISNSNTSSKNEEILNGDSLQEKLKQAIAMEEYEEAAKLRDKIKELIKLKEEENIEEENIEEEKNKIKDKNIEEEQSISNEKAKEKGEEGE